MMMCYSCSTLKDMELIVWSQPSRNGAIYNEDGEFIRDGVIPIAAEQWGAILAEGLRTGELTPNEVGSMLGGGGDLVRTTVLRALLDSGTECFGAETLIDMWPLDPTFKPGSNGIYDQDAMRAKIWQKPIDLIKVGDMVVSFDDDGNMVPGYVPRTFLNEAKTLLNFHGTRVTPGHVYYRPDSKKPYKFETLIDVLRGRWRDPKARWHHDPCGNQRACWRSSRWLRTSCHGRVDRRWQLCQEGTRSHPPWHTLCQTPQSVLRC